MDPCTKPIIMAIDDDPILLNLTVAALRKDYSVRPFASGATALKYLALARERPDLAILDYQMPEMSGVELFQAFLADPRIKDLPVIFMTGLEDAAGEAGLFELGAAGVVHKPVKPHDLLALVERHLPRRL